MCLRAPKALAAAPIPIASTAVGGSSGAWPCSATGASCAAGAAVTRSTTRPGSSIPRTRTTDCTCAVRARLCLVLYLEARCGGIECLPKFPAVRLRNHNTPQSPERQPGEEGGMSNAVITTITIAPIRNTCRACPVRPRTRASDPPLLATSAASVPHVPEAVMTDLPWRSHYVGQRSTTKWLLRLGLAFAPETLGTMDSYPPCGRIY
jgi:hypothetical protein